MIEARHTKTIHICSSSLWPPQRMLVIRSSRHAMLTCCCVLWQVRDGDTIKIDAGVRTLDVTNVDETEMGERLASWQAPPYKATSGTLYKYIKNVSSASLGCVTDL